MTDESPHEFPCEFRIEMMGRDTPEFRATARALVEKHAGDEAWRRKVLEYLVPLENRLPAEYRALPDAIDFEDPDSIGPLLDRSTRMLTARLQSLGSEE